MTTRLVSVITVLAAVTATVALAQEKAPPKVSKAEVQKLVGSLKSDKAKFALFCQITKLDIQSDALAKKNQNDPKLQELSQRMADLAAKIGPDYERIIDADMDEASSALVDDLSKSCNVGFKAPQAAPKATKAEVQQLVNSIKSDKEKLADFCTQTKLANQAAALTQKNPKDPKLKELGKQMDDIGEKLGADYQRIVASDLDEASAGLLDNLYKSCK